MLNSRMKDKIYAFLSFFSIVLAIGSFAAVANFLLETNKYIFSVNEKIVKEKTTTVNKAGFESIKARLSLKEGKSAESSQEEEKPAWDAKKIIPEISLSPSPQSSPSSAPEP